MLKEKYFQRLSLSPLKRTWGIRMKCPNCEKELVEGNLYCEFCGYEIQIVPDFEPEIENSIIETLTSMAEELDKDANELEDDNQFEQSLEKPDYMKFLLKRFCNIPSQAREKKHLAKQAIIVIAIILGVLMTITGIKTYQYNSYNYQVNKALSLGGKEKYAEAVSYLERAIKIDDADPNSTILLAQYYCAQGRDDDAILVLESAILTENGNEEIYRKLIEIYEKRNDYERISKILSRCNDQDILSTFQSYAALPPEFSVQGGTYEEVIPLKLLGNTSGAIYYTLDGSKPDANSPRYTTPIYLESGSYKVSAVFENQYGVMSEVVKHTYHVAITKPEEPQISLYSGLYRLPEMIEVEVPEHCTVYYTIDGKVPTMESTNYTEPIPMPFGATNFKFAAFSEEEVSSDIVERSYQLDIPAIIKPTDAVNITVEALVARGLLLDTQGHIPEMEGNYLYICSSGISFGNQSYYLVMEFYQDKAGTLTKTINNYAVNAITGELCMTAKELSGYYQVIPF